MNGEYTKSKTRGTTIGDLAASIANVTAPKAVKPMAVKTPSFKAPKTIGHKGPPIVAKGKYTKKQMRDALQDANKKVEAGGPGSGRHQMLTDLAEKVGKLHRAAPNTYEGIAEKNKNVKALLDQQGVKPKELAGHITKMATASRKRVNVNWLKNMER